MQRLPARVSFQALLPNDDGRGAVPENKTIVKQGADRTRVELCGLLSLRTPNAFDNWGDPSQNIPSANASGLHVGSSSQANYLMRNAAMDDSIGGS